MHVIAEFVDAIDFCISAPSLWATGHLSEDASVARIKAATVEVSAPSPFGLIRLHV